MNHQDIPPQAIELHQRARQHGAAGQYNQALELLAQAQRFAPGWPYPPYDMAFTYLLMQDFANARVCYERTVQLSPRGFFTALTALHTLNREAAGELPQGTYAAYMSLEWIEDAAQKAEQVQQFITQLPQFAPGWKEYALLCEDLQERMNALEKGLAANPDAETQGLLLLNKAMIFHEQGDKQAAKAIVGPLAFNSNTTFATEQMARQTLAMIGS